MVNYKLGKIYRLECNVTGLLYVGSTCEPTLAKRLTKHVASYRSYLKGFGNRYVSSFKILENNDYDIILIEKYPCNDIDELHSRECYFTNQIDCVNIRKNQGLVNRLGGKKEYDKKRYIDNKDKIKEKNKEYYIYNRNKYNEYSKEYYYNHKDKIIENKKEYYNNNKDKVQEKNKDYYNCNKEIIRTQYQCACGGRYTHDHKSHHFKTKKHIQYMENQTKDY